MKHTLAAARAVAARGSITGPHAPYMLIVSALAEKIESGEPKPGDRVPSVTELVETCNVSPSTARRALAKLKETALAHSPARNAIGPGPVAQGKSGTLHGDSQAKSGLDCPVQLKVAGTLPSELGFRQDASGQPGAMVFRFQVAISAVGRADAR